MAKILNREQLMELLRRKQGVRPAYELAKDLGITPAFLSDIFNGKRDPGETVLNALGLDKETIYVPKGSKVAAD